MLIKHVLSESGGEIIEHVGVEGVNIIIRFAARRQGQCEGNIIIRRRRMLLALVFLNYNSVLLCSLTY